MRLVATEYLTLDGVFEEPGQWSFPFFNEQASQFKWRELQASDALLLGRKTYEGFAAAWPGRDDGVGFAEKMNSMPKYVVSSTLTDPAWNNTTVIGLDDVARLREEPGGDLLVAGSGDLVRTLLAQGLVDELRLMVFPVVLGAGRKLLGETEAEIPLELVETRTAGETTILILRRKS
jgi:dihydrofolate reductase